MVPTTATIAKQRAAATRTSSTLASLERRYVAALASIAREVAAEYMRALAPHLAEVARADASGTATNTLQVLGVHVQIAAERAVGDLFDRHARDVLAANARAQRALGIRLAPDDGVKEEIARRRKENVDLVVKAQRAYAASVVDIFNDPDTAGLRVEELKARLLERGDVSEARAELIARDQTLKLNGAVTQIRQENAGVTEYIWSTSKDERVRDTHAALEGTRWSWDAAPEVGHPGEDFQCRCVALPVIAELEGL